ncbi:MAG TPA: transferrin receptor-like dimerization domain-containing protein [Micropepsaceae bacterium]|nr:transferrin receptor-like dimerization domain-containing protein [Micropepsaceae bacterium]
MRRAISTISVLFATLFGVNSISAQTPPIAASANTDLERRFDASISPVEMGGWMKTMAAEPNHVGSPHNKANAEMVLAQFKSWGWDARIETFEVLYPTPISESLELAGATPFKATLTEAAIPGDETSSRTKNELPAYVVYQGDGDVTAPLVYVNYGMQDDYKTLERLGVSVRGKIVIARYGVGWRGLKPKLAQEHGAVGCIIYSDPRDDGYSTEDSYPKGPARPANGFQRGSVADMTLYPGDPLTPGIGATANAQRLTVANAPSILKIPVLPISHGDAQHFLAALDGRVVPPAWRGSLPITYHVGGGAARAHLAVKSEWGLKTIYNVVATMKGSENPDQWILRGNHHDGWVFGAADPMSGHIAMMGEAKAIGALASQGWRPKRTLVYLSWDAEEPMLLGSTEWAETHADELKQKGLVYINSDGNGRGFLNVEGSHSLQHLVNAVAADVSDPETGVSVGTRLRARLQVAGTAPGANEESRERGKIALDPARDLPIEALGSGSDYSSFLQHLGLAALNVGFGGEGQVGGVYHSAYDTYEYYSRFGDPGFVYAGALAKTVGRLVLRMADADVPPQRYGDFAETVSRYLDEVKKLADTKREAAEAQAKMLAGGAYRLADDPTKTSGAPTPLKSVPHFNLAPLENAVDRLKKSAKEYDTALAANGAKQSDKTKSSLFELTRQTEETLAPEIGLPGRTWYKNLIYAPGRFTGYDPKTLPGVREAIEEERWDDADRYAALTASALDAYANKLDEGVRLMTPVVSSPQANR